MKIKLLNGIWNIVETNEDIFADTSFPRRIIRCNISKMNDIQMFKHCMIHELTHAYQAELGQWQNILGNGKYDDDFDCEWIAEFVAIYAEQILKDYEKVKKLYKEKV